MPTVQDDVLYFFYDVWNIQYVPYLLLVLICVVFVRFLKRKSRRSLKDEVILITGASSGIGEALAKEFFAKGAQVILTSRRLTELERVKRELMESGPGLEPEILPLDLSDLSSIPGKVKEIYGKHDHVDVVVHNAGILSRGEADELDLSVFQNIMLVNYFGVVCLTKELLPKMKNRMKGHIVAVSSVQGRVALPRRSAYAASKHALVGFMDSLRAEVAHLGIDVTCAHPGYVKTNIAHVSLTSAGDLYGKADPNIESGYDTNHVAVRIVRAVETATPEVVIAPLAPMLLIVVRTVCPSLFFFIMKTIARSKNYY